MITIFHGRELSLHGTEDLIYAEVAVALRDQIYHFNTGKSCTPFAVFIKIALHTDEHGWAFPGIAEISLKTGVTSRDAIAHSLRHLQDMRIEGHRILQVWRERTPDGRFGRSLYRIFPDAWTDGLAHIPDSFNAKSLTPVDDDHDLKPPDSDDPPPACPDPDLPDPEDRDLPDPEDPDPVVPGPDHGELVV